MREMFIEKEDRLSRATPPRRLDRASRRRGPRDWQKPVRLLLYTLLGLLGGVAIIAVVALLLDRPTSSPEAARSRPDETAQAARPLAAPPLGVDVPAPGVAAPDPATIAPPLAIPAAPRTDAVSIPTLPAAPAPGINIADVAALQAQIREANAMLATIRAQEEQARKDIAEAARARQAAQAEQERQRQAVQAATDELKRTKAVEAEQQRQRDAAQADERQRQAQLEQQRAQTAWADAERTIQALSQRAAPLPPLPAAAPPAIMPSAASGAGKPAPVAGDEAVVPKLPPLPAPAPSARPKVFLRYLGGSAASQQLATEVAQRLLFSDFAYSDTRSVNDAPVAPTVRYFFPEDAAAAQRLAALLSGTGQDMSDRRGQTARGALEVWLRR
jgi:hypothetical protein